MLKELDDEELDNYLEENPQIIPLFEVDIIKTVGAYTTLATTEEDKCEPDTEALMELCKAQDAFE